MKLVLMAALMTLVLATTIEKAEAFEANGVRIKTINSFNGGGHLWVEISADNDCPNPHAYFIIQRWDNVTEPQTTDRKLMYQLVLTAFAAGKNIRVVGATCYLNQYLFADQVIVSE
jgi:hypothetical protein